ncbi:superfamily II DNA or RNA helicase/DNA-binding transcriptional ArsR family regulator [Roseomonas alkaliterrae]|uniref:Superfamily II DNA or RNA helicase/DNA-binding transcriptional ArsR family regulator n=1 Tax=Neoroseomonas alkaliterrae TaxID=1452450 RepID=A0A840Y306_9PROT|nr:helicase-related protein [Neoroseomonas alkaliterrae]MBB5688603.1 superfamily II DNA or RNA helicase/DNA-binding transcriptional ArsR family regulator [Neoroseomonas alkaliterrae]
MSASLRDVTWPRFLRAPDGQLVARLYEPALRRAVRYDRCCAYFSSSVLSAAASGFGAFIQRVLDGEVVNKPAIRLLVNEELSEADVAALLDAGQEAPLVQALLAQLGSPETALQKRRLEMLAWLAREGWLEVRVGIMRQADGILHAKFGLFVDAQKDAVVFAGSGNESANGLRGNYEKLEISWSWGDAERHVHFRDEFEALWSGNDPAVASVPLPQAVRDALIKLAPDVPPVAEAEDNLRRQRAAMLWSYALAAPYMPEGGAATCDAMAPVTLWPHQRRVVAEAASAWPEGRLLCDEVGMGKTVEAILILRRLLAGRGVKRALLLPPANLLPQWQGELREKGGLRVPRLEGPRTLVWPDGTKQTVAGLAEALEQDLLLLSRETARTEGNLPILLAARPWDLVLLDEGHAARRASQIEGEFNTPTLLLGLLRRLQATGQARSFMILSATPMQTHPWEPWDLLQVLGEGGLWLSGFHVVSRFYEALAALERGQLSRREALALARILAATPQRPSPPAELSLPPVEDAEAFAQALRFLPAEARTRTVAWLRSCSPLARRMHRNTRRTLRRYYEMGLLERPPPQRDVREDPFDFETQEEREVYEAVTRYIDRRFDELEGQKPGKGFVMTIYRRRAASSPVALRKSLERRAMGLKAVIAQRAYDDTVLDLEDAEELEDLLNVKLTSALPETPQEAAAELAEVEDLLSRIASLGGLDTKRDRLVAWTKKLTADGRGVLIFTGYTDTMEYLRDALASAFGSAVASYSGEGGAVRAGQAWIPASKEAVTAALRAGTIKVLVCTDAASEGLNLQAAGALVNFDLPWNPSKVEQRIGRVDRIGQELPVLPIVNLYLQDSVDERVYRALARRCGLFETFVGPMQPVLSQAIRMLIGKEHVDEEALAKAAEAIRKNPAVMQAFPEDEPAALQAEEGLFRPEQVETLLSALEGTGIRVKAESNTVHLIGTGPLRIVTHPSGVVAHPEASCVDGLDARQWRLLRELQQPGERLPLVLASAEEGAFRAVVCGWVSAEGLHEVRSFADLQALMVDWDGQEPPNGAWKTARLQLAAKARQHVSELAQRCAAAAAVSRVAQAEAARLRLIEELGRTLICFEPDTNDLNGKFHRLATERTATAERLQHVYGRLGGYPEWDEFQLADLREFRTGLTGNQVKTRLTGRELDAAMADPRWALALPTS